MCVPTTVDRRLYRQALEPCGADYGVELEQGGALLGFDGHSVEAAAVAVFAQEDVNGFDDFVMGFGFAAGADHDAVAAAVVVAEGDFLKFGGAGDLLFGLAFAVDPFDIYGGTAFEFIEALAKRIPILRANFFHDGR